jgi:hypothetical protein
MRSYQVCNFHYHNVRWVAKVCEDAVTHVLRDKVAVSESYFLGSYLIWAFWPGARSRCPCSRPWLPLRAPQSGTTTANYCADVTTPPTVRRRPERLNAGASFVAPSLLDRWRSHLPCVRYTSSPNSVRRNSASVCVRTSTIPPALHRPRAVCCSERGGPSRFMRVAGAFPDK